MAPVMFKQISGLSIRGEFKEVKVVPQYHIAHPYWYDVRVISARKNERVHVHNERNYSQAKLDSEINAGFLLNEHRGLY